MAIYLNCKFVENLVFFVNPFALGTSRCRRENCVFTARFSAIILGLRLSAHDERRLTLALVYMVIGLCVVKKWKGQICMKITSFTMGPIWSPGNGNAEA